MNKFLFLTLVMSYVGCSPSIERPISKKDNPVIVNPSRPEVQGYSWYDNSEFSIEVPNSFKQFYQKETIISWKDREARITANVIKENYDGDDLKTYVADSLDKVKQAYPNANIIGVKEITLHSGQKSALIVMSMNGMLFTQVATIVNNKAFVVTCAGMLSNKDLVASYCGTMFDSFIIK